MVRTKSLVLAVAILMLLMLTACGGGGRTALQPAAPVQPADNTEQAVPPGSDAEGVHEQLGLEFPLPPPWETEPDGPTWTDPFTGYVYTIPESCLGSAVIGFKLDDWWIEEDYPVDENTPPWEIDWRAAVEDLESRGYTMYPVMFFGTRPPWIVWQADLPDGMTFFDVDDELPPEFPCIAVVAPLLGPSPSG